MNPAQKQRWEPRPEAPAAPGQWGRTASSKTGLPPSLGAKRSIRE